MKNQRLPDIDPTSVSCRDCRHLHPDGLRCAAFPEGIPLPVLGGVLSHLAPIAGDHGIQFEPLRRRDWEQRFRSLGYALEPGVDLDRRQLLIAYLRASAGKSPDVTGVIPLAALAVSR